MTPPSETPGPDAVPPPALRPLRRDARQNREVVLAAARRMFAAHGADCSFEDIARDAGVGVGTVYRRFPDRRTLIEAILEQRVTDVDATVHRALALGDAWAAAQLFIGSTARMQLADRGLRDLLHEDGFVSEVLAMLRQRIAPAAEEIAARLRHDGARSDLTGDDAKRRAFGDAARDSILDRTWARLCDELVGHYEKAIRMAVRGPEVAA